MPKQHLLLRCVHHKILEHLEHNQCTLEGHFSSRVKSKQDTKNRAYLKPTSTKLQLHGFPCVADFRTKEHQGTPCVQEARQSADHTWPSPPFAAERSAPEGLHLNFRRCFLVMEQMMGKLPGNQVESHGKKWPLHQMATELPLAHTSS